MKGLNVRLAAVLGVALASSVSAEEMFLAPIFSDHMVFAVGKPVRVFGTGEGDVRVGIRERAMPEASRRERCTRMRWRR